MNSIRMSALVGLALALGGCGANATSNRGVSAVHQPVVARSDFVFDVPTSGGSLDAGQTNRLKGWFDSLGVGYGDRVSVDGGGNYDHADARQVVGAVAARYGLLLDDNAPVTAGAIQPGSIRVVVSRLKASVPGCPDWSRASQPNFGAHSMSNYGCATSGNLAAMVADPSDLVEGRKGDPSSSAAAASKAIQTYRAKPATGTGDLKDEETN
jgi:pilus assembly protein CpaD